MIMARQTITLSEQNDAWLKEQVTKAEFSSKSEAVNYLIMQARDQDAYVEFVGMKLEKLKKAVLVPKQKKNSCLKSKVN